MPYLRRLNDRYSTLIPVLLVAVVALAFRLGGLTYQSHWNDELISAFISAPDHSLSIVLSETLNDVHPPLYQLLLWGWYHVFGYSELSGRLLSAVAGSLSIVALYFVATRIFGRQAGIFASLMLSVNLFHLYYSQETRSYALLVLLTILALHYFFRSITEFRGRDVFGFALITVLVLYTHYFYFFVVIAQAIYVIFLAMLSGTRRRFLLQSTAAVAAFCGVCLLPLAPFLYANMRRSDFWISEPVAADLPGYFIGYFGNVFLAAFIAIAILFAVTKAVKDSRGRNGRAAFALLATIILTIGLAYIKSRVSEPVLTPRNTIVLLAPLFLLVAYAVTSLRRPVMRYVALALILGLSLRVLYSDADYYERKTKQEFRELTRDLIASESTNPMYALPWNIGKFSVYFAWAGVRQPLINVDIFADPAQSDNLPAQFWLLDILALYELVDLQERLGYTVVSEFRHRGVYALLLER